MLQTTPSAGFASVVSWYCIWYVAFSVIGIAEAATSVREAEVESAHPWNTSRAPSETGAMAGAPRLTRAPTSRCSEHGVVQLPPSTCSEIPDGTLEILICATG